MPVPIWVSDLAFVPNSSQVATSSRHGHVSYETRCHSLEYIILVPLPAHYFLILQVRLYDPKSRGCRPVISCVPEAEEAWTCITIASRSKYNTL
jgi:hypothetical protein